MPKAKFFCVGVGPGDPSLMTVKAVETIKKCPIIFVPQSEPGKNLAMDIASEHLAGKNVKFAYMPMTKDQAQLDESHQKAADEICFYLERGQDVAFLTLGDPGIYATTAYVYKIVVSRGFEMETIPGITSFCAAAARLNMTLCEGPEPLHIIPGSYNGVDDGLSLSGTKILMKSGRQIKKIKDKLLALQSTHKIVAIERATMKDEKIYENASQLNDDCGYFLVVVLKELCEGKNE